MVIQYCLKSADAIRNWLFIVFSFVQLIGYDKIMNISESNAIQNIPHDMQLCSVIVEDISFAMRNCIGESGILKKIKVALSSKKKYKMKVSSE